MREKPPIAFYNFLPLVSRGIEDTGRAPKEVEEEEEEKESRARIACLRRG